MKKIFILLLLFARPIFCEERELRAAWIATVFNIDWPSQAGDDASKQQQEMIDILDTLAEANFNAVFFQIKPSADAFYRSKTALWSRYLMGTIGLEPSYDPLDFFIKEARKRNLEVHAWINPFRISNGETWSSLPPNNIARKNPSWVVSYGGKYYFNPGLPEVRAHIFNEINEIVRNYDIDAIHMDDYFYPYKIYSNGKALPFDDDESYKKYGKGLDRDDWRRKNTELFIEGAYSLIKKEKKYVQLGISPFGVWRNASVDPRGSKTKAGQTNYDDLYADILKWVEQGWVDYLIPQIYWDFTTKNAEFDTLADWWSKTIGTKTKLYVGIAAYKLGENWTGSTIKKQIDYLRADHNIKGAGFFSAKWLLKDTKNIKKTLKEEIYPYPALPPASDTEAPDEPKPYLNRDKNALLWKPVKNALSYAVYEGKNADTLQLISVISSQNPLSYPLKKDMTYKISALSRGYSESKLSSFSEQQEEISINSKTPVIIPLKPKAPLPVISPKITKPIITAPQTPTINSLKPAPALENKTTKKENSTLVPKKPIKPVKPQKKEPIKPEPEKNEKQEENTAFDQAMHEILDTLEQNRKF